LIFCGSLFSQAAKAARLTTKKPRHFDVVSYERFKGSGFRGSKVQGSALLPYAEAAYLNKEETPIAEFHMSVAAGLKSDQFNRKRNIRVHR